MKQLESSFKAVFMVLTLALLSLTPASAVPSQMSDSALADGVEISLLTCSQGHEIWAQYGHTAIRYRNAATGEDFVVNYGMFSSDQPYFIPRFIFGLTDYRMDIQLFSDFCFEYQYEGRGVTEQVLDITAEDKANIYRQLQQNALPENIVYRYNFFYDNCTTRARDMLVGHLRGKVAYPPAKGDSCTFRSMIHQWNHDYPWSQFGEDMLLGVNADRATTKGEQQFLPYNLQVDFDRAIYNGHPLVKTTREIVTAQPQVIEKEFALTPMQMALLIAVVIAVLEVIEIKDRRIFWGIDVALMLASGLVGIVLTAMIFSQHPCVSLNMLIFFFNPLPLFYMYRAVKRSRQHREDYWWRLWLGLIIIGFLGRFVQYYQPAVVVLALILLTRPLLHLTISRIKK